MNDMHKTLTLPDGSTFQAMVTINDEGGLVIVEPHAPNEFPLPSTTEAMLAMLNHIGDQVARSMGYFKKPDEVCVYLECGQFEQQAALLWFCTRGFYIRKWEQRGEHVSPEAYHTANYA